MDGFWMIVTLVALVGLMIVVVVVQYSQEQERQKQLRAVAHRQGYRFSAAADPALLAALSHFHLFSQGRSRKISNLLQKEVEDIAVSIFDYRFTTGGGEHSHTHRQTVALFRAEQLRLPGFTLRPEGVLDKLGSFVGYQDIDFEAHLEFSDTYLLRGVDEARIRETFTDTVLAYYAGRGGLCTEGNGQQIIYYRASQQVAPESIARFLGQGLEVVKLFYDREDVPEDVDLLERLLDDAQAVIESLESNDEA